MKLLIVVDMQNDFIDGVLGTPEAQAIVPRVVEKIKNVDEETVVLFTKDTHYNTYSDTLEGKKLPVPHCIEKTDGWCINKQIRSAWLGSDPLVLDEPLYIETDNNTIFKNTFGSTLLFQFLKNEEYLISEVEMIGVCTDICVVSNALIARAALPNTIIKVDASCCAGVTPEKHKAALEVMKSCQIDVYNEEE